jgi:CRP/FNR family cyclic AMP-dependent transcriptional regulator
MQTECETERNDTLHASRAGEFFKPLSSEALREFESLEFATHYPSDAIVFLENETPTSVLILLEGQVKLSINSIDGRRLILGIAQPGEILGLTAVLSGCPYEIAAETLHPCKLAALRRQDFLNFLVRHPVAYQGMARELSLDYTRACEQLRTVGLALTAQAKLARLLVEWCATGQQTRLGTRLTLSLTHREIGECIGSSRETVSRMLSDFKRRHLLDMLGSTLIISDRPALECCAGMRSVRSSDITLFSKVKQFGS